jgi:hypothetical protein
MFKHVLQQAAGVVLFACAMAAQAADPAMNEAARAALRDGNYAKVVQLTAEIAKTEPDAALNWYRLAIAAARMGDPVRAGNALAQAERVDPSLRFASTPQRVEKLRAEIRAALAQGAAPADTAPAPVMVAAGPSPAASASPSASLQEDDPSATAAVAVVGRQLQGMQEKLDQRLDKLAKDLSAVSVNQAAAAKASSWERAAWIVGFLMAIVASAAMIAVYLERSVRARREAQIRNLAQLPLLQLVATTRDANAILLQRLEQHGHKDTDLYAQLVRSQPALERESGKSRVAISPFTNDKLLVDTNRPLQPKAKVLGHSDPGELHRSVAARVLQQNDEGREKLAA